MNKTHFRLENKLLRTFPEECTPFQRDKYNTTKTANRQSVNCHLGGPILYKPSDWWRPSTCRLEEEKRNIY